MDTKESRDCDRVMEEFNKTPLQFIKEEKRLLVIECNYLPSEYKDMSVEEAQEILEKKYDCKVMLIDGSRINIQGVSQIEFKPVYYA